MGVLRRGVEVDDAGVETVPRVDGEGGDADDLLEGSRWAERHAAGERLRALDVEADDPRLARKRGRRERQRREGRRQAGSRDSGAHHAAPKGC